MVATVVITEARTKKRMKKGKIFLMSKEPLEAPPPRLACQVLQTASTSVMGMMARVRVSLTMVAYSSTEPLVPWRVSQVEAAAVTEEVSLMAVPAKRPKPSLLIPMAPPRVGKDSAARMLNRKITEMAWAISSSSAPMTGAVAAMALPPQMEEPTPTSTEMLAGIFIHLRSKNAITRDMVIVVQIMGRDRAPTLAISERFSPKPSRITAYCRIFLEVKAMPAW